MRRAFTVVEVLVVLAILGLMMALLLPAVQRTRAVARRIADQNNLHQLGLALHHYAAATGHLPPLRTVEGSRERWWFAAFDPVQGWDTGGGHLMPYLEQNAAALQNPAKAPGPVRLVYEGRTGGYGYNHWYLGRADKNGHWAKVTVPMVRSTSQTVAFVTAAVVTPTNPEIIETAAAHPPSRNFPSVHHRFHGRIANILFLDGHVEANAQPTRKPPATDEDPRAALLRDREHVYDYGVDDTFWDRD